MLVGSYLQSCKEVIHTHTNNRFLLGGELFTMVFVGAAVFPHGALPFDGNPESESQACRERYKKLPIELARKFSNLYDGMQAAAKSIAEMEPDVIILHTPHSIELTSSIGVHINDTASGSALWKGEWDEFKVSLRLSSGVAQKVIDRLQADGVPVAGISSFSGVDAPLRWGEVIPAWFIINQDVDNIRDVQFVVVTKWIQPEPLPDMSEDILAVGRSLSRCVDDLTERVVFVASGDLSHAYQTDHPNPIYRPLTGCYEIKTAHDEACEQERNVLAWARATASQSPNDEASGDLWAPDRALPWLQKAAQLDPVTYSCGMFGFIVLHAFLESQTRRGVQLSPRVTCCEAPTYYGMMAAVFSIVS